MRHIGLLLLMGTLAVNATTHLNTSSAESCTSPFLSIGGTCLYFDFSFQGTWHETREFCQGMNSDLAILSDPQLYADVLQYIDVMDVYGIHFWIGGSDEASEGRWMWINNAPVRQGAPFWASYGCDDNRYQMPTGGTSQNCLLLDGDWFYFFNDAPCDVLRNALCEKNPY